MYSSSSEEIKSIMLEMQSLAAENTPWYAEPNIIATIWLASAFVCAFITLAIAHENERSKFLAFITGFFLGALGIAIYAIIGETVELRVYKEEKERRSFAKEKTGLEI